jgi:hypothetical protein
MRNRGYAAAVSTGGLANAERDPSPVRALTPAWARRVSGCHIWKIKTTRFETTRFEIV